MRMLKDLLTRSDFTQKAGEDGHGMLVRKLEGSHTLELVDAIYKGDFSPQPDSIVSITLKAEDGTFIYMEILRNLEQISEVVEDFIVIADFMRFEKAPDQSISEFALFDSSDEGYCVVSTPVAGFGGGRSIFTARSKYLNYADPETKGVVTRTDSLLEALRSLDNQVDLDRGEEMVISAG